MAGERFRYATVGATIFGDIRCNRIDRGDYYRRVSRPAILA
jgi:hypothetical protein